MNTKTIMTGATLDEQISAVDAAFDAGELTAEESNARIEALTAAKNAASATTGVSVPDQFGMTEHDWSTIRAFERLENLRGELSTAQKAFIASLPVATDAQVEQVLASCRDESQPVEGFRVNLDFRLTTSQLALVSKVRAERAAWCATNKALLLESIADAEHRLTSYKIRVGSKKTVTTLRFERSVNVVKKTAGGYVATLLGKVK